MERAMPFSRLGYNGVPNRDPCRIGSWLSIVARSGFIGQFRQID